MVQFVVCSYSNHMHIIAWLACVYAAHWMSSANDDSYVNLKTPTPVQGILLLFVYGNLHRQNSSIREPRKHSAEMRLGIGHSLVTSYCCMYGHVICMYDTLLLNV
jgi:hypothetical protein